MTNNSETKRQQLYIYLHHRLTPDKDNILHQV